MLLDRLWNWIITYYWFIPGVFIVYSTYRFFFEAVAIMSPRPDLVSAFKRERAALVFGLGMQARVLRADLQAGEDFFESLRELVASVHRLKDTSMVMAADARGNAYVRNRTGFIAIMCGSCAMIVLLIALDGYSC